MLISTVISLSDFFSSSFPNIFWYPSLYLGNPYQYLIGPVVPALLAILNTKYLILNTYLVLIFLSFIIGAVGIYCLLSDWGVGKRQAIVSSLLYVLMPFGILILNYQNGLSHIAFSFFPFILLFYRHFLASDPRFARIDARHSARRARGQGSNMTAFKVSLLIAFVLLIDISILLPIVIGFIAMLFALENKGDWGYLGAKSILILLLSLSLATVWYTPGFFWVLLSNPSLGGIGLFNLIISLFKLLLNLLPIALAVLVVKWRKFKPASRGHLLLAVLFFSSFLFLTLVRFLLDPDFVMDWSGFVLQLQFGAAIILGQIKIKNSKVLALILIILFSINLVIYSSSKLLNSGRSDEYQSRIVSLINTNVNSNERIFLSGSSVFFLNQYLNVLQVRGGVDQGSVHPFWGHGAYQIREGKEAVLAHQWLSALGVSYILVHESDSEEMFHDFKNTEKFAGFPKYFRLINTVKGDVLYKIEDASIARIADKKILSAKNPLNGADEKALSFYVQSFRKPLEYKILKDKILVSGKVEENQVISLAITFNPNFVLNKGEGKLVKDLLGNMVIIPKNSGGQSFVVSFVPNRLDHILPLILSLATLLLLINYGKFHPYVMKKFPSVNFSKEDDY